MRHYEIVLLIHPDHSDQLTKIIEKYKTLIFENKGRIHRLEDWGKRPLAYSINKLHKAHYILMNIEVPSDIINKISDSFKYNDLIIRNIIINVKKSIVEVSPMIKFLEEQINKKDVVVSDKFTFNYLNSSL